MIYPSPKYRLLLGPDEWKWIDVTAENLPLTNSDSRNELLSSLGLVDKNGKIVFENDICELYEFSGDFEKYSKVGRFMTEHGANSIRIVFGKSENLSVVYNFYFLKDGVVMKNSDINSEKSVLAQEISELERKEIEEYENKSWYEHSNDIDFLRYIMSKTIVVGNTFENIDLIPQ